jgi:hypothetical protein
MITKIQKYCTQIGEDPKGHRQWMYEEKTSYGYKTISFWSMPGDYPSIGDTIEEGLLVKNNKDQAG